ncbi:unnamed protein product [Effrenium voratum]|nr:unnamed protein product [Effrenium voratum]
MMGRFALESLVLGLLLLAWRCQGQELQLWPKGQRHLYVLKSLCFVGALWSGWRSMQELPLGIATGIIYCYPVLAGLFASIFLQERLTWTTFAVQAAVCLLGAAMILPRPFEADVEGHNVLKGVLAAGLSALLHAVAPCIVRSIEDVKPWSLQLCQASFALIVSVPLCATLARPVPEDWTPEMLGYLLAATLAGLSCSLMVTKGTLLTYWEIPLSFSVQVYYFRQVPQVRQLLGACLIASALAWSFPRQRTRRLRRKKRRCCGSECS